MSDKLNTCHHLYDDGGEHCNSAAAVTGQNYCAFHLRHRARQLRIAQIRARSQRFDLKLPPLESMSTVLSALNQIVEAVAADMIDLKRARIPSLTSLRLPRASSCKSRDKWHAQRRSSLTDPSPPPPSISTAEYGLPRRPRPRHPARGRLPAFCSGRPTPYRLILAIAWHHRHSH